MTQFTNSYTQTSWTKRDCHKGNTLIWTHPGGGSLYMGGWNMGATYGWNTHVIDLTGMEHKFWDVPMAFDEASKKFLPFVAQGYAGWLSLPFPDFKVPSGITTPEQWQGIADTISDILAKGTDVLVACHGGHGRSGLFISIVGYLLAHDTDASWSSPVQKVRLMHCDDAVETFEQERFVYAMLGLDIQITRSYVKDIKKLVAQNIRTYQFCPICGTESQFIGDCGMCLGCRTKYEDDAPVRDDLTLDDIKHKGLVDHSCQREKCVGIWRASKCKHVVHDQIIYDGYCTTCWDKQEDEQKYAERVLSSKGEDDDDEKPFVYDDDEKPFVFGEKCAVCGRSTMGSATYGICYDCAESMMENNIPDFVHNSITDPYGSIPHTCNDVACYGIVIADVCMHVVHNREVLDGKCPDCRAEDLKYRNQEVK